MTIFDDDVDMWEQAWADRLLKGESVDGDHGISGVIAAVRATADGPAPMPNAELATLLRDGLPSEPAAASRVPEQFRAWSSRTVRAAVAGVAASLAMGAGVATAAAGGAGALDYVPEPVKRGVDAAVTAVADVLRSEPKPATQEPAVEEPATSGSTGATTTSPDDSAKAPAPAASTTAASTAPETPVSSAVPTKPVETTAPEPTQAPAPLTPSALPTPDPSESPSSSPSPDGSPSPEGEGRKPLDNSTPSPSPSPSESASPEPTEGEAPAPAQSEGTAEATAEQPKDKPGRAELTIERIN